MVIRRPNRLEKHAGADPFSRLLSVLSSNLPRLVPTSYIANAVTTDFSLSRRTSELVPRGLEQPSDLRKEASLKKSLILSGLIVAASAYGCAGNAGSAGPPSSFAPSHASAASNSKRPSGPAYYGPTILIANGSALGSPPPGAIVGFTLPSSGGNISPTQYISGSNTQLANTLRLTVGPAGSVFASNAYQYIYKFPKGSSGNVSPGLTLDVGAVLVGGMAVDSSGDLWVAVYSLSISAPAVGEILEYANGAHGKATPINTIAGSRTGLAQPLGLAFAANGNLYVGNNTNSAANIEVFSPTASGNSAPIATISGSNTKLADIWQIAFDNSYYGSGRLLVADSSNGLLVFAPGASGNASPGQAITNLQSPVGIAADTSGDIYGAGGTNGNSVREYRPGATGNATPLINITGSNTKLGSVGQIFIADQ